MIHIITNIIVILILVAIIGGIIYYIHKQKKKGVACIGCPYAKECGSKCSGGCHSHVTDNQTH